MTHDEHVTRAMLLGMAFIPETMVYRKNSATTMVPTKYFDAETMEPMTIEQTIERMWDSIAPQVRDLHEDFYKGLLTS